MPEPNDLSNSVRVSGGYGKVGPTLWTGFLDRRVIVEVSYLVVRILLIAGGGQEISGSGEKGGESLTNMGGRLLGIN